MGNYVSTTDINKITVHIAEPHNDKIKQNGTIQSAIRNFSSLTYLPSDSNQCTQNVTRLGLYPGPSCSKLTILLVLTNSYNLALLVNNVKISKHKYKYTVLFC